MNTMKRLPLITSFALFIALCVSAAYWAMQLFNPPLRAVAAPPQSTQARPNIEAAAGLLGGYTNAVVSSNFQLKGVVMASNPADSVAILAANGKKPQVVRTNAEVVPGVTVKEVQRDHVLLSERGVIKRVELPKNAKRR
jgi:general secretion pathway protein C